jgi:AcrR family transcriptional regulator
MIENIDRSEMATTRDPGKSRSTHVASMGGARTREVTSEGEQRLRCAAADRREQLIRKAAVLFTAKGVRGTTTSAIAAHCCITEPVLYSHFETKDELFREVVKRNVEERMRILNRRFALIAYKNVVQCVETMAEITVRVYISGRANGLLTAWAQMEFPEYACDLHRIEVGSIRSSWERTLASHCKNPESVAVLRMHLLPYAIQACVAYGFWLAALRHTADSSASVIRQFAAGIGRAASTHVVTAD